MATASTREENARIGARVLAGLEAGPRQDLVALNAAAGLRLLDLESDWRLATARAQEAMASGAAIRQLRSLIEHQNPDPATGLVRLETLISD